MMKLFFLLFVLSSSLATPAPKAAADYRLPTGSIEAKHYKIDLTLSGDVFESNTFLGYAEVTFTNIKATNEIKIHANKLRVTHLSLIQSNSAEVALTNEHFNSDPVTDILTITTAAPLSANSDYILRIDYMAELRTNEMYGFYKSSYIDENGNVTYLGTTQFQPTHARKAFPCFDEPSYKAKFDITIKHPTRYTAVGNTLGTRQSDPNNANFVTTTFATTPRMSTYLIAFVVSDFTCDDSTEKLQGDLVHSVCSRKEEKPNRELALDVGPKLVKALEDFTGIPYNASTIGKLHQFAIPDFSAGAMENWGLITYRETGLLWDPALSSNSYKQSISNVIAHELAHMWFGNLVTTHWWSDTFLNEGFARFFQYFATHEVETDWELDRQFVTAQVHSMLDLDAQPAATALSHEANSPAEVSGRFGSVSYNKGASILRMIIHIMGYDNFKAGIQQYLQERQFDITTPEILWSALSEKVPLDVLPAGTNLSIVIDNWINKPGFPVLDVKLSNSNIAISQKRFLLSDGVDDTKWYVPISYTLSTDTNKFEDTSVKEWLLPTSDLQISNIVPADGWIILNNQQTGFYRIHYDDALLARIKSALLQNGFSGIHVLNRAQLINDVYTLARAKIYNYRQVFEFFEVLKNDSSYYSWVAAFNAFNNILFSVADERITNSLSALILNLMQTLLQEVPFERVNNTDQIYTFNRVQAHSWACRMGLKSCIDKSVLAFQNYKANKEQKPDKNLKTVILCNGLRHSQDAKGDWDFLWSEYENTKLATERATLITVLGCSKDREVLHGYLYKSINSSSGIRQQDANSVFTTVYTQNPGGVDIAFDFLLENYRAISTYYGSMNALNNLFSGLANRFTSQSQIDKLKNFLDKAEDLNESLTLAATAAVQNAEANLKLIAEFEKELADYFEIDTNTADVVRISISSIIITLGISLYHLL